MKKYAFTCFLLLATVFLMAQTPSKSAKKAATSEDKRWQELELNTIFLFREILGLEQDLNQENTYWVGFKTGRGNTAWRLGLGGSTNVRNQKESLTTERNLREYQLRARIGLEWRKMLSPHWYLISGIDAIILSSYRKDTSISTFDEFSKIDRNIQYGVGPLLGVRYQLNPRIAIYTEAAIHAFYHKQVIEQNSKNLPEFDEKKVIQEYPIRFSPPINLYLNIRL